MNDLVFLGSRDRRMKSPTKSGEKTMNYAQEQRLHLIDFLLLHYGFLQREQLVDFFAVSPATATRDLTLYDKMRPGGMAYNTVAKRWERTMSFRQMFASHEVTPPVSDLSTELTDAS